MSRKVVGMDGSEWFPKIGVSCLRCKKRGEVCYWPLESKRPDGACHRCKGMKLACRVEEESQSEVPTKKARVAKGKGKARATPTVAEDHIPGLVAFFGCVDESLRLLVDEACHTSCFLISVLTSPKIPNSLGMLRICYSRFVEVRVWWGSYLESRRQRSESWRERRCRSGRRGPAVRGWGQRLQSLRAL